MNYKYFIPVIGAVNYIQDVESGEAFVSAKTDLFFSYHFIVTMAILITTLRLLQ